MLLVGVDTPPLGVPPAAPGGEWRGANFALGSHGRAKVGKLVRLGKNHRLLASFKILTTGSTMTFSIRRAAVGNPAWFTFNAAAARETPDGTTGGGIDLAPNCNTYRYILTA
jgi:hypothetical protein